MNFSSMRRKLEADGLSHDEVEEQLSEAADRQHDEDRDRELEDLYTANHEKQQ